MPVMQGNLSKSSNGVSPTERPPPPPRPTKPGIGRVLPHIRLPSGIPGLNRWRNKQGLTGAKKLDKKHGEVGVKSAEEEEPKTEDSFDYKDIDFASEIFDFRIPVQPTANRLRKPPRPPPPPPSLPTIEKPSDPPSKTVAFCDIPLIDDEKHADEELDDHFETQINAASEIDGKEVMEIEEIKENVSAELTPEEKLTKFLRDHEGQELSKDDVEELEKLLNETDEAEKELIKETTSMCSTESQTRFDDQENEENVNLGTSSTPHTIEEISVELEREPKGHTDFSVMEFNNSDHPDAVSPSKTVKIVDDGLYEPVGEPVPPCQRQVHKFPDMSGFIPPTASPNTGDPFSWRRRGMRRWDRYGYEKSKNDSFIPATLQILEGCRQVEHYIMSRELSPPGYLLGVLGTNRKLKRRKKKKKKAVPVINVTNHLSATDAYENEKNKSFEEKVSSIILQESFEELRKSLPKLNSLVVESNETANEPIVEKENLVVTCASPITLESESEALKNEELKIQPDSLPDENSKSKFKEEELAIVENTKSKVDEVNRPATIEVAVVSTLNPNAHVSRKESFTKKERPPRPLPPTPQCHMHDSKPVRPSRRPKRVSSAEPPSSIVNDSPLTVDNKEPTFQSQTFPRRKEPSRRSLSTEEIQRRIQLQAQQFFRTPRKKELHEMSSGTSKKIKSQGSSFTMYDASLRRRPRSPKLAPVYTPINKNLSRKKDFASQTDDGCDSDREEGRESSIPPPPPPKMLHLLSSFTQVCEDLTTQVEQACEEKITGTQAVINDVEDHIVSSPELTSEVTTTAPEEISESQNSNLVEEKDVLIHSQPSSNENNLNSLGQQFLKLGSSDVQIALFCGFLPPGCNLPSNLTQLPEMTVHRLNVDHLEAGFIKVAQVEAAHLMIQNVHQLNATSQPSSVNSVKESCTEETKIPEQQKSLEEIKDELPQSIPSTIDVNGNDSFVSEKPSNWDDNSSWTGGGMIPSSSSASYVTCDETLHESITDSEFGTDIEDFEQEEEVNTGCITPTPEDDVDRGDDYDLLRQVFEAAVANGSFAKNNGNNVLE